jgi:hypothetical protein
VDNLVDLFGPAIATLEKLQGAWEKMGSDLQALNTLFSEQGVTIPPMLLEQLQLNQIVEQWNTLKNYGMFNPSLGLGVGRSDFRLEKADCFDSGPVPSNCLSLRPAGKAKLGRLLVRSTDSQSCHECQERLRSLAKVNIPSPVFRLFAAEKIDWRISAKFRFHRGSVLISNI